MIRDKRKFDADGNRREPVAEHVGGRASPARRPRPADDARGRR